jgi:hypothetical protein
MRSRRSLILLALLLLVSLAALGFLALDTDKAHAPSFEADFRGCAPEEAATEAALAAVPTPTPFGPDISNAILNQPENATPFLGRLCDFVVGASEDEGLPNSSCPGELSFLGGPDARNPTFVDSELNGPGVTEQVLCDGTPVATYGEGGRRIYFQDEASVYANATPRERLRVIEVDGHAVLVILPRTNPGTYFFHAILRPSSESQPGILMAAFTHEYEAVIAKVRAALSE